MISSIKHLSCLNAVCCNLRSEALHPNRYHGRGLTGQMLFVGSPCERLCMVQFALISLIPGLIRNLRDCADPALDEYSQTVTEATSLKTSDRVSCELSRCWSFVVGLTHDSARLCGTPFADLWKSIFPPLSTKTFGTDRIV